MDAKVVDEGAKAMPTAKVMEAGLKMNIQVARLVGWTIPNDFPYRAAIAPNGEACVRIPDFSTDIAADYTVLVRVRETWDHERLQRFAKALYELADTREGVRFPNGYCGNMDYVGNGVFYEPGDFSRAALAAPNSAGAADGK